VLLALKSWRSFKQQTKKVKTPEWNMNNKHIKIKQKAKAKKQKATTTCMPEYCP
jgi:hypothetical protein